MSQSNKIKAVVTLLLLLAVVTTTMAQIAVVRYRMVNSGSSTSTIAGVWTGTLTRIAVGDTIVTRKDEDCIYGLVASVLSQDTVERTFTLEVSNITDLQYGRAVIYRGVVGDIPDNMPASLFPCIVAKAGGADSTGTSPSGGTGAIFTLDMTDLYADHPDYPRKAGDDVLSLETTVDVAPYLQALVDSAAKVGGTVLLGPWMHTIKTQINVPEGVTIKGTGSACAGDAMAAFSDFESKGTVIRYSPVGPYEAAFRFYSSGAGDVQLGGLQNLTITTPSLKGRAILVDGGHIMGGRFSNIVIHGFQSGAGIDVRAAGGGDVQHLEFEQIDIFRTDTAIVLYSNYNSNLDNNTFRNINVRGQESEYGVLAMTQSQDDPNETCENNLFENCYFEQDRSEYGHLVVKNDASVIVRDCRFKAADQDAWWPDTALVRLLDGTRGSRIELLETVTVEDRGSNIMTMRSQSKVVPTGAGNNRFLNSNLIGLEVDVFSSYLLPNWLIGTTTIGNENYSVFTTPAIPIEETLDPTGELPPSWNVIRVRVPQGYKVRFLQHPFSEWQQHLGEHFTLAAYVFSVAKDAARWEYVTSDGTTTRKDTSDYNGTGNQWAVVGGTFENYPDNQSFKPNLVLYNYPSNSIDTLDVYIAMPVMYWGEEVPNDIEGALPRTGGQVEGPLAFSFLPIIDINKERYIDTTGNLSRLYLPVTGNVYRLTTQTARTITQINSVAGPPANNPYAEYFPGGTMITLINNAPGLLRINDNPYIHLMGDEDWAPDVDGAYLTLINDAAFPGEWHEVGRGEVDVHLGFVLIDYSDTTYHDLGDNRNLRLPPKVNVVDLINARGSGVIRYINKGTYPRKPGEILMIRNNIAADSLVRFEYPFVETIDKQSYDLPYGEYIVLMQTGTTGVWREVARSEQKSVVVNAGLIEIDQDLNPDQYVNGDKGQIVFPKEYHYVRLKKSYAISRINEPVDKRMPAGDLIVLENASGSNIALNPPYIKKDFNGDLTYYSLKNGEKVMLVSEGNGVWAIYGSYESEYINMRRVYSPGFVNNSYNVGGREGFQYILRSVRIGSQERYGEGVLYGRMVDNSVQSFWLGTYSQSHRGLELTYSCYDWYGRLRVEKRMYVFDYYGNLQNNSPIYSFTQSGYAGGSVSFNLYAGGLYLNLSGTNTITDYTIFYRLF